MSLLITGLELPEPGQIVLVEIDENGDVFAAYDGGRTKLSQYQAVPVPAHGRLGDLDALLFAIPAPIEDEYKYVRRIIEAAPTIIPAEEVEA